MKNRLNHVSWIVRSALFKIDTQCFVRELGMRLVGTRREFALVVSRNTEQCVVRISRLSFRPQSDANSTVTLWDVELPQVTSHE